MENEPEYHFIHSVDPTKKKVIIRERFAKLTLSSNKKKEKADEQQRDRQSMGKRQSASRNILELLDNSDRTAIDHNEADDSYTNPLLRSNSSSGDKVEEDLDQTQLNPTEEDQIRSIYDIKSTERNDALGRQEIDREVALISQKVSTLTVSSKPITINSDNALHELPQLPLQESKRLNASPKLQLLTVNPETPICLFSESDTDESADSAITISSASSLQNLTNVAADIELVTSCIPKSGETEDAILPNTFSNEKADRMEAFLRDVSQTLKEMNNTPQPELANFDASLVEDTKAHKLASAETESMSPQANQGLAPEPSKREQRLMALDDTISMSQSHASLFAVDSCLEKEASDGLQRKQCEATNKQVMLDETEPNTVITQSGMAWRGSDNSEIATNDSAVLDSTSKSVPPENSITISETSTEAEEFTAPPTQKEIVLSEPPIEQSYHSSEDDGSLSQIQMNMGSINISAKINIKIHIPQQSLSSSEDEAIVESGDDRKKPSQNLRLSSSEESVDNECNEERNQSNISVANNCKQIQQAGDQDCDEDCDQDGIDNFTTNAEKMLNQLYGHSWQTPDNIRTLKHTKSCERNTTKTNDKTKQEPSLVCAAKNGQQDRKPKTTTAVVEDSMLNDFTIFRQNIMKTNMNSTLLDAPKTNKTVAKCPLSANANTKRSPKCKKEAVFKTPQTLPKKRAATARERRGVQKNWRKLIGTDSDTDNASDDADADLTNNSSDDNGQKSYKKSQINKSNRGSRTNNKLVYLDLSKDEVEEQEGTPCSPPANNDETFQQRLQDILRTCQSTNKPKLECTPKPSKSKRILFTPNVDAEPEQWSIHSIDERDLPDNKTNVLKNDDDVEIVYDQEDEHFKGPQIPASYVLLDKRLAALKRGQPSFPLIPTTPKTTAIKASEATPTRPAVGNRTPKQADNTKTTTQASVGTRYHGNPIRKTPEYKYSFLKSLDAFTSKELCHPDALQYRDNYRLKREELANILYDLYNSRLFNNSLDVPLVWNKKLLNTAGRCLNKKKQTRTSVVELSEKVLTSADRLRCTLVHELCHAATWVFNGEGGHGRTWKQWAHKANSVFPELPKIGVCHQYDIEYKYTYKCTMCQAKSHAHSKSKKVENIRCSYCHGAIEIYLNKKDKEGNVLPTPVREATGFAKFVKDNYKQHKRADLKHADVMKILSNEFAALKLIEGQAN